MVKRLSTEGAIWDLHIHTCLCPKGTDEFSRIKNVDEYVDLLVSIFKDYPELEMISFTDHNKINREVYLSFEKKKTGIKVLPGVEVDTKLVESGEKVADYKHLLFYFDDEEFVWGKDDIFINEYIDSQLSKNSSVDIGDFLNFLITKIRVRFVIDPHFLKQDSRGIDYDWNDPEKTKSNMDLFTDQFFCFWEASGNSAIAKGLKFLSDFDSKNKISIIHFSDANNSIKLKSYLSNPNQYFNALPSFEGLRMAGSEIRRITKNRVSYTNDDYGRFIGKVHFKNGQEILFSPRLNTIIGGRGSGKSLLLDSIYLETEIEKGKASISDDRKSFISDLCIDSYNSNGNLISTSFNIEYYNQNWVYSAFASPNDLVNDRYFISEFSNIPDFDLASIKTSLLERFSFKEISKPYIKDNISSIQEKIKILKKTPDKLSLKGGRQKIVLKYPDYFSFNEKVNKQSIIPSEVSNDKSIVIAIKKLFSSVCEGINSYNEKVISDNLLNSIVNKYTENIEQKNKDLKNKNALLDLIKTKFDEIEMPFKNRVAAVNGIVELCNKVKCLDSNEHTCSGFENHLFIFRKELSIENPLRYLHRILVASLDDNKVKKIENGIDKKDFDNLPSLIDCYCFHLSKTIMESVSEIELDKKIFTLSDIIIKQTPKIIYRRPKFQDEDFLSVSPGTRANYVMEYIVNKKATIPLLIDQPEDNIDNSTIAGQLTEWISNLKTKRQIIVATHDPNIVVNADSENIVVCEKKGNTNFTYSYGALELKESLDSVKTILEGGTEALERRIDKYGNI